MSGEANYCVKLRKKAPYGEVGSLVKDLATQDFITKHRSPAHIPTYVPPVQFMSEQKAIELAKLKAQKNFDPDLVVTVEKVVAIFTTEVTETTIRTSEL
jgi:hypothetical protein